MKKSLTWLVLLATLVVMNMVIVASNSMAAEPCNDNDLRRGSEAFLRGDFDKLIDAFMPSAIRGCPEAMHNMGVVLSLISLTSGDHDLIVDAYMWLTLAAKHHPAGPKRDNSLTNRDSFVRGMTPKQISEGERLAALWRPGQLVQAQERVAHISAAEVGQPALRDYVNPEHGWTIAHPDGWAVDATDPSLVLIKPTSGAFALVGVHTYEARFTKLSSLVDFLLDHKKRQFEKQGYTVKSRVRGRLSQGTPYELVLDEMGGDSGGRSLTLVVLVGSTATAINAETYAVNWPAYADLFERIAKSLRLEATPVVQCNYQACGAAYKSFRATDCTFQPKSGPRRLCTR